MWKMSQPKPPQSDKIIFFNVQWFPELIYIRNLYGKNTDIVNVINFCIKITITCSLARHCFPPPSVIVAITHFLSELVDSVMVFHLLYLV